ATRARLMHVERWVEPGDVSRMAPLPPDRNQLGQGHIHRQEDFLDLNDAVDRATEEEPMPPAKSSKPNILFIMGDDIGWYNPSCYHQGVMGYETPNIDRIAREGIRFTDFYAQQSCTAGRAAFITGQQPIRTGLTKVGLPGAKLGLSFEDPTVAD